MLDKIKEVIEHHKFDHYGWAKLETPMSLSIYQQWLKEGMHADMDYMVRHLDQKENPQKLLPKAHTAFVFARPYLKDSTPLSFPKHLKVALYARLSDYHDWFQKELEELCKDLKKNFPQDEFLAFTDSKPVLERDLAYRAGLGWVGKNTCLINEKKGSLFFIGEIYSTLNLFASKLKVKLEVAPDRCGTCTRCIDVCPTQALIEPKKLDARKCISYWTIEAKQNPPVELRNKFDNWYYGCDLCQTVCPWNHKTFGAKIDLNMQQNNPTTYRAEIESEILKILNSTDGDLLSWFKGTPLERAKPWAHRRNAILVAVNLGLKDLSETIQKIQEPKLQELKAWAGLALG